MFSITRRRRDIHKPDQSRAFEASARVAIDERGIIIYASPSFRAMAHINDSELGRISVFSVVRFESTGAQDIDLIKSGLHTITINGQKDPFPFQFDWLTTSDQKRYVIGSLLENEDAAQEIADKSTKKNFEQRIIQAQRQISEQNNDPAKHIEITQNDLLRFSSLNQDIMVVVDDLGTIVRSNEIFLNIMGYDAQDIRGKDFIDIFENSERPYIKNTIQTLNLGEDQHDDQGFDFEAKIQTKSGDIRWVKWQYCYNGFELCCIGRDITDLKTQTEALERHERQLSQAESIGRMGHWRWVIGRNEISWSPQVFDIFGVPVNDFKPTLDTMNAMVDRQDIDRVNQAFQRAIIEQNDYDVEFRINRPDGEIRYIRCEGRCECDTEDDVIALFGIMQDMTEQHLYEQQLRAAKDAAEQAYNAKSQFLANMSHELRTPLNAIIGFSEMIERQLLGPIGNEKYVEYVSSIRESGEHLLDIISDILDMSKIEAGKYELALEEVSVLKVIRTAMHMMENKALDNDIKLSFDGSIDEACKIVADRRALLQILLNLLSNAVKFTRKNGHVSVECHARDDYVAVKVIDDGIGIPANKMAAITNPFVQASSHFTREHEGSGLGLAITKDLVKLHGGLLSINSEIDVGTTVSIRLPYEAKTQET